MTSDESGQNNSQPALPEYQPPHVVRMNGVSGGFGTCTVPGAGNQTGSCSVGAANTGYDGCFEGTTNSIGFCRAGTTNTGNLDCTAGGLNNGPPGSCVTGGGKV
jgi:hypothetical protein